MVTSMYLKGDSVYTRLLARLMFWRTFKAITQSDHICERSHIEIHTRVHEIEKF